MFIVRSWKHSRGYREGLPEPTVGMPCRFLPSPRPFLKGPLGLGPALHWGTFHLCGIVRDQRKELMVAGLLGRFRAGSTTVPGVVAK